MEDMVTNINEIDRNEGRDVGCIFESRIRIKQAGGHRTIGAGKRRLCTPWAKKAETE